MRFYLFIYLFFILRVAIFISGSLLGIFLYFFFFSFLPHSQYAEVPGPGIEPMPHNSNQSHGDENAGASTH